MVKVVVLLLLLWKVYITSGDTNLYKAYYDENFVSFVEKINSYSYRSLIWEIFRSLEMRNSSETCKQHLAFFRESVTRHEKWAIEFLDSSGISGTGWLSGNTISLGDYQQCLSSSSTTFTSSYCLVNLKISNNTNKNTPYVPHNVPIVFSLCMPSGCKSQEIELLLEPSITQYNQTVTVECQSRRPSFSFLDFLVMFVYVFLWIIIISTTIPKKWIPINHEGVLALWESFSVQKNLTLLLRTNDRIDLLTSLHSLRVLSQCTLIWYHIILGQLSINYPVLNKFYFNKIFRSWEGAIETELVLAVDTFFLISGILLTWNCLKNKSNLNLYKYYIHRYLRITPPYLAVLTIVSTFANKLCNGPLCNYIIDKEKKNCASYWWSNILYINNFYPGLSKSCMPHSWYLAADWQLFFFLSPFVVIIINKWPQHLFKLIAAIFIASVTSSFYVSYWNQLPTENLMYSSYEEANNYYNKLYSTPYVRAGPWAVGMFFGALLHNFKNKPVKFSKNLRILAWLFTIVGLCLSVELDLPFLRLKPGSYSIWNALFNTLQRNIWAISICWIIFLLGTQKSGPVRNFLCWSTFQPLAKLSYSAYLIHKLIISLYFGETYGYNYISTSTQIPLIFGIIFISYISAFLLYMSFEAPIANLEKILFSKETISSSTQSRNGMKKNSLVIENIPTRENDSI